MDLARYNIELASNGHGRYEINGEDVSDQVTGFEAFSDGSGPARIVLFSVGEVHIQGKGVVEVQVHDSDPREALANLDLKEVERRALDKFGWDSEDSMTTFVVQTIMEMFSEVPSTATDQAERDDDAGPVSGPESLGTDFG